MPETAPTPARATSTAPGRAPGRRRLQKSLPRKAVVYTSLGLAVLVVSFPLVWMLGTAVKSSGQVVNSAAPIWPTSFHWGNIATAWTSAPFDRWFLNTVIFSVGATLGQIASGLLAGYAFAMFDFPGKRILFYALLSGLMIPFATVIVPVYQILADLHWLNTYQGLIVPNIASALGAFLFRQYFLGSPMQLAESARVDGAPEWRIFLSIYVPLARPVIAAFAIIAFLQNWNNFLFPLVVISQTNMEVVSQGLSVFQTQFQSEYNLIMAASTIAVVPILLVAVAAQRQIVEGITLGAVQ